MVWSKGRGGIIIFFLKATSLLLPRVNKSNFWERAKSLCVYCFEMSSYYVAQAGPKLSSLLPQPPVHKDDRYVTTLGLIPEIFHQGKLHHKVDSHFTLAFRCLSEEQASCSRFPAFSPFLWRPVWNLLTHSSSQTVLPHPSMALNNVRWCTSPESQFLPWTSWPISFLALWSFPCFFPKVWAAFPKQLLPSHLALVASSSRWFSPSLKEQEMFSVYIWFFLGIQKWVSSDAQEATHSNFSLWDMMP